MVFLSTTPIAKFSGASFKRMIRFRHMQFVLSDPQFFQRLTSPKRKAADKVTDTRDKKGKPNGNKKFNKQPRKK